MDRERESESGATADVQRVLLVDDHALFREGMASLLGYEDDFEVVGQAPDGEGALAVARELMPDLVLMDIDMPGRDGIEVTRRLTQELPYVKVVMLTVHDEDDKLFEAVKAGAHGYLVKSIRSREMLDLLRGMARGEAPISRAMATRILQEFARTAGTGHPGSDRREPVAPEATLTPREREVLELVARRYSNKEIAGALVITEYTVKNHLRNILSKLHLKSRTEAARYAHDRGLLDPLDAVDDARRTRR
jgi:DNA-binding NarL/FixJ family response regulator